jgi:hypothetical protein
MDNTDDILQFILLYVVPYKRVNSNLEGNFERFHKYGLIPSLNKICVDCRRQDLCGGFKEKLGFQVFDFTPLCVNSNE